MLVDTLHEDWKVTSHLGRLIDDDKELMSYQPCSTWKICSWASSWTEMMTLVMDALASSRAEHLDMMMVVMLASARLIEVEWHVLYMDTLKDEFEATCHDVNRSI